MIRFICIIAVSLLASSFDSDVIAQQLVSSQINIKVSLSVSGNDNFRGEIRSYLTRELRSLNDVLITDEEPDYEIV